MIRHPDRLQVTPQGITAHSWICPVQARQWSEVSTIVYSFRLLAAHTLLSRRATAGARFVTYAEGEIAIWDVKPKGCGLWPIDSVEAVEIVASAVACGTKIEGWEEACQDAETRVREVMR